MYVYYVFFKKVLGNLVYLLILGTSYFLWFEWKLKSINECFGLKYFLRFFIIFFSGYAYSNCTMNVEYLRAFKSFQETLSYEMERITTKFFSCDAIISWLRRHFLKRLLLLQVSAVLICSGQILTLTHTDPAEMLSIPLGKHL